MLPVTTRLPRSVQATVILHLALMSLALVLGSGTAAFTGSNLISVWWPAIAVCTLAVMAVPRRWFLVAGGSVLVWMTVANMLADRPFGLSFGYGLANAVEAVLVSFLLTYGRRRARLERRRDVLTLLGAAGLGAAIATVIASVTLLANGGSYVGGTPVLTSHASALLTILPLALTSTRSAERSPRWQLVAQPIALTTTVLFVFWPGHTLPLAFLPMPFLVWGTLLYSSRAMAVQLAAVAITVTSLTAAGHGPFAAVTADALGPVQAVQIFLITYAASIFAFATGRDERQVIAARLAEREQVLRGGLIDAQIGLVIMHEVSPTEIRVVEANVRAAELLAGEVPAISDDPSAEVLDEDLPLLEIPDPPTPFVAALVAARLSPLGEWYDEFETPDQRQVELFLTRVPRGPGEAFVTAQVVDVTQRHLADAAMQRALSDERAAAARLREVNRQKDDFLSSVSHELRTPITSILGYVELIEDETELDDEQRAYLAVVERNARRLGVLVEDLLDLGAGAARNERDSGTTDLRDAVQQTCQELLPVATARGVRLEVPAVPPLLASAARADVGRILTNLMTNAIKFTPADGSVTITTALQDDHAVLTVTDTGSGIAPDELEQVFGRFYRSAAAEESSVPGTGLGLALVRSLVERNGGAIALDSDGASYTTATVRLPLVRH
ncbi:two-component sensor histidine kinase [Flavimobilis marinus]|uniref:histidine kinase n=1 Tax=Flavimobilis marinus TaxID=285351 RepID=A0A1I2DHN7_9MICO|nr:ATP-binding protein [Flavimobilis marinus]GHG45163.1 two-component sensor histidine kinase [Flavimobilis marinus]SFE80024.1 hypothetical protein SAMN04488035_0567 [Flavimobilis marinus]